MAITSGFFNSLNGDREYNAAQISEYMEGLIGGTGVYENVGGALQVLADTGLSVNVQPGKAQINNKWVKLDAVEPLSITSPHVTLNRYTAVVLELNTTNREITLKTVDGTPATTPTKPSIVNTSTIKQICLAYVYVPAGIVNITQAQITDTRADTNICGWVTSLINQVNTSTLFNQWQNAYEQFFAQMTAWYAAEQSAFDTWFAALTQELNVNTYLVEYSKTATITSGGSRDIPLDMTGYTYDSDDKMLVFFNGLKAALTTDYTVNGATPKITVVSNTFVGDVEIIVYKSQIGWSQG